MMRRNCRGPGALLLAMMAAQACRALDDGYAQPVNYGAVEKRLDCPTDYFSCADQGSAFADVCCQTGSTCALDQNNEAACCPSGNVCTGTAPASAGATATPSQSYVSDAYFVFPAIPTSFRNTGACSSAVSACESNYEACTSDLASGTGGYAVTVQVAGGGGTTVAPAAHTTLPEASATSICASLSSAACYDLQATRCASTGSGSGFYVGTANAQPRQTAACMAGVFAGVGVGILGAQL